MQTTVGSKREIKKGKLVLAANLLVLWKEKKAEDAGGWVASEELKEVFKNFGLHQGHRKDNEFQMTCSSSKGGKWTSCLLLGWQKNIRFVTE